MTQRALPFVIKYVLLTLKHRCVRVMLVYIETLDALTTDEVVLRTLSIIDPEN